MSKILVTGGAGFIGSHIVDKLVESAENPSKIIIVDNLSTGKKENINENAKFYHADILSKETVETIFEIEKPQIVIHTAAQVMLRESLKDPITDAKINILGTINVLEACRKSGVKKIIYTSTGGARVGNPIYLPVDEKHPINPVSPYGISKYTAENYVQAYNQLYGPDYLIFCFGNVYGPRDDPATKRVIPSFLEKMLNGESPIIFGDGSQTRDFIYVEELAEFIVNSIDKNPNNKLFYLANGTEISIKEIFQILKELTGFSGNPHYVEEIKGEVKEIYLDTSLAKKELGWEPKVSIREGLEKTVEHFKKKYL